MLRWPQVDPAVRGVVSQHPLSRPLLLPVQYDPPDDPKEYIHRVGR